MRARGPNAEENGEYTAVHAGSARSSHTGASRLVAKRMNRMIAWAFVGWLSMFVWPGALVFGQGAIAAQTVHTTAGISASATGKKGVELATTGQCREALPLLKRSMRVVADKELKYNVAMSAARCAMSLDQKETAADALFFLNQEFPQDPRALYLATHYFSELAARASQELEKAAPNSPQTHQLQAEALESQGKWDEAAAEYRGILEREARVPGVHYRLGRVYLSMPDSAENTAKAKSEFSEELKVDPTNASAEFLLGEIARRNGEWEPAIEHFAAAAKRDAGFAEAFLALGMSLNAAERFADAVAPLQKYTAMAPGDPAGHYQLATAYSRTGRKGEATRELSIQLELTKNATATPHRN